MAVGDLSRLRLVALLEGGELRLAFKHAADVPFQSGHMRSCWGLAGLPEPVAVEPVSGTMLGERHVAWREALRQRSGGGPAKTGYGFRIRFPEAVAGPVALGEASHFGMWGFEADGAGFSDLSTRKSYH